MPEIMVTPSEAHFLWDERLRAIRDVRKLRPSQESFLEGVRVPQKCFLRVRGRTADGAVVAVLEAPMRGTAKRYVRRIRTHPALSRGEERTVALRLAT